MPVCMAGRAHDGGGIFGHERKIAGRPARDDNRIALAFARHAQEAPDADGIKSDEGNASIVEPLRQPCRGVGLAAVPDTEHGVPLAGDLDRIVNLEGQGIPDHPAPPAPGGDSSII